MVKLKKTHLIIVNWQRLLQLQTVPNNKVTNRTKFVFIGEYFNCD